MSEYLFCYDIRDPHRLGRIHRFLRKRATALQYSVFLYQGTELAMRNCLTEIEKLMDPRADDVRAYPLPEHGLRLQLGPGTLPEGIFWSERPVMRSDGAKID